MAEKKNTRYTYSQFAEDILELLESIDISEFGLDYEKMSEKARALIEQQERKRAYNANKRAENAGKPKELSDKMKDLIALIKPVIPKGVDNAVTGADINRITGSELYAMQISNACTHIPNCQKTKVIREVENNKGLKQQKEYTAYYIAE